MLNKYAITTIRKILEKREPVVVISHVNPDGDAIGSSLALALFLKRMDVPVSVIIPNLVPEFLQWLPGYEMVLTYQKKKTQCKELIAHAKTLFLLDFNDPERAGGLKDEVLGSDAYKVLLDHHQDPADFTDLVISEPWRGSVGEMVYLLITEIAGKEYVDHDMAACLYVAIMTDTGNFRYASSYSGIFNIVGELVETGIDKDAIYSNIYDSYSVERMKLMGYCMSEKLVVLPELHAAYISLDQEELKRFDHKVGDTEGFVNIPFSIRGIRVTALFIEKKDHIKISLRSKGNFSVEKIASAYFKGGGHINAAGGESELTLSETLERFESILETNRDELR
jgi:bifunctional oligoribonuclease and PAP phosphatase NrnA